VHGLIPDEGCLAGDGRIKRDLISDEGRFTGGDYEKLYCSPARTASPEKNKQTRKSEKNIKVFGFSGA